MNVPRCMSTQHPDNATSPFFTNESVIQGEGEIREAYYVYSHLGCTEQMWDYEGKEVDAFVVKKLLTRYESFFRKRRLGEDLFLTLRVPNPRVERLEGKVLLETLESIPRSYDIARTLYGDDAPSPILEVILPMTACAAELNRVYHYYAEFVGGKERQRCYDMPVSDWVGEYRPDKIQVIPLIEDMEHLLEVDSIVEEYLRDKNVEHQRVFLARSDPALNYGQLSAVLLNKIALQRLDRLQRRIGVELLPIVGVGSAPFRGNLRPGRVEEFLREYPSVQTFTIQSAFKYDYPQEHVRNAIAVITESPRAAAQEIDAGACLPIIRKVASRYAECVIALAPLVNEISKHIPRRRARKLHIGLFGYSRNLDGNSEIRLPRAIGFCASLYSIGLPPEILGLSALTRGELKLVRNAYVNIDQDIADSLRYLNEENLAFLPGTIREDVEAALDWFPYERDEPHAESAAVVFAGIRSGHNLPTLEEEIVRAATRRRFLG